MATAEQLNFIREIAPMIREEALARGYHVASPVIGQALTESLKKTGISELARKYHNYFGIKASKGWTGGVVNMKTGEVVNGAQIVITAGFRVYPNMKAGVIGYFDFIAANKRYKNVPSSTTPEEYLSRIKEAGYASDPVYFNTCMRNISLFNLRDYDKGFGAAVPYIPSTTLRRGSRGADVMWLQEKLNTRGFNLEVDGIFGIKTENAVKELQKQSGYLAVDGIVGSQTKKYLS